MKTLTILEPGDKVFWLNSEGFQEGKVKTVHMDSISMKVMYRCSTGEDTSLYHRDAVEQDKAFGSYRELLNHYASKVWLPAFDARQTLQAMSMQQFNPEFNRSDYRAVTLRTVGNSALGLQDSNIGALYYSQEKGELVFVYTYTCTVDYHEEAKNPGKRPLGICSFAEAKSFLNDIQGRRRTFVYTMNRFRVFITEKFFTR